MRDKQQIESEFILNCYDVDKNTETRAFQLFYPGLENKICKFVIKC